MADLTDELRSELISCLPRLRRFARALTGDPADADDLVQAALEKALTRLHQWQAGTNLRAWLFRIVKTTWIDEVRFRRRRRETHAPEEDGAAVGIDPAPRMEARSDLAAVTAAMNDLPEDQRLAVSLVLVEGCSYREAADILEIPMGTLTSRLARGRAALERAVYGGKDDVT